jgi:hypothetical protein
MRQFRSQFLDDLPGLFSDRTGYKDVGNEELTSELHHRIGQLKVELDGLKKHPTSSAKAKRSTDRPRAPAETYTKAVLAAGAGERSTYR